MHEPLSWLLASDPPPAPRKSGRKALQWPFAELQPGYAATFNRSASSVRRAMYRFKAPLAGAGKRFVVRELGPSRTRVWRFE